MSNSVYDTPNNTIEVNRHILTILVDNEPGVLARVIGMFSGRGYNIDSLNVAEVNNQHLSRITIVTHGTTEVVAQIQSQLMRIVPVHSVTNLGNENSSVEAEVALVYFFTTNVSGQLQVQKEFFVKPKLCPEHYDKYLLDLPKKQTKILPSYDYVVVTAKFSCVLSFNIRSILLYQNPRKIWIVAPPKVKFSFL